MATQVSDRVIVTDASFDLLCNLRDQRNPNKTGCGGVNHDILLMGGAFCASVGCVFSSRGSRSCAVSDYVSISQLLPERWLPISKLRFKSSEPSRRPSLKHRLLGSLIKERTIHNPQQLSGYLKRINCSLCRCAYCVPKTHIVINTTTATPAKVISVLKITERTLVFL